MRKKEIATPGNAETFFFQQSPPAVVAAILISRKFVLKVTLRRQTRSRHTKQYNLAARK